MDISSSGRVYIFHPFKSDTESKDISNLFLKRKKQTSKFYVKTSFINANVSLTFKTSRENEDQFDKLNEYDFLIPVILLRFFKLQRHCLRNQFDLSNLKTMKTN